MDSQLGEQLFQFSFVTDDPRAISILKGGLQKFESNVFGDDICDANQKCLSAA